MQRAKLAMVGLPGVVMLFNAAAGVELDRLGHVLVVAVAAAGYAGVSAWERRRNLVLAPARNDA